MKISKFFNTEYKENKECGTASNLVASVMLNTVLDDGLLQTGYSREIVNRIQKLRKTSGISIEDRIEIFYESSANDAPLDKVIKNMGE